MYLNLNIVVAFVTSFVSLIRQFHIFTQTTGCYNIYLLQTIVINWINKVNVSYEREFQLFGVTENVVFIW